MKDGRVLLVYQREVALNHKPSSEENRAKYRRSKKAQKKFRQKLAKGEIDIGPLADHSMPVKDLRAMVDPQRALANARAERNGKNQMPYPPPDPPDIGPTFA